MTDLLVGATAGLSSSVFYTCTAGQASSGTQTIIPLCHMPTKRTELLRTNIDVGSWLSNRAAEKNGSQVGSHARLERGLPDVAIPRH
jgi:hypothetical protein